MQYENSTSIYDSNDKPGFHEYEKYKQDYDTQKAIAESPLKSDKNDDNIVVYRGGGFTDLNFTPRPNKDDGTGIKSGLSAFMTAEQATFGQGGKAQALSVGLLKLYGFEVNIAPDGHVGIRPPSQEVLKNWAKSRPQLESGAPAHDLTKILKATKVNEVQLPKKK